MIWEHIVPIALELDRVQFSKFVCEELQLMSIRLCGSAQRLSLFLVFSTRIARWRSQIGTLVSVFIYRKHDLYSGFYSD